MSEWMYGRFHVKSPGKKRRVKKMIFFVLMWFYIPNKIFYMFRFFDFEFCSIFRPILKNGPFFTTKTLKNHRKSNLKPITPIFGVCIANMPYCLGYFFEKYNTFAIFSLFTLLYSPFWPLLEIFWNLPDFEKPS